MNSGVVSMTIALVFLENMVVPCLVSMIVALVCLVVVILSAYSYLQYGEID